MAFLYINEFQSLADRGVVDILPMPPVGNNAVAIAAAPGTTITLGKSTKVIRVASDAVCSIRISKGPVTTAPLAASTDMRIPANAPPEYFTVVPGSTVNVITNT